MRRKPGRPMKYHALIQILEDDVVYTPAAIFQNAYDLGIIGAGLSGEELAVLRRKVRHTFSRFSTNHDFELKGDGWVKMPGQPPERGWFGWRWKGSLPLIYRQHHQQDH